MTNLPVPSLAAPVVGFPASQAYLTAQVYNPLTFALNVPLYVGTQTVAQSLANTAWAGINMDTEQVDTYSGHSTTTNPNRYTAQVTGWYDVCGVVNFSTNTAGSRGARIAVNASAIQGSAQMAAPVGGTTDTAVCTPVRSVFLNTNDFIEVQAWQSSGGALSTHCPSDLSSALWVAWRHT